MYIFNHQIHVSEGSIIRPIGTQSENKADNKAEEPELLPNKRSEDISIEDYDQDLFHQHQFKDVRRLGMIKISSLLVFSIELIF